MAEEKGEGMSGHPKGCKCVLCAGCGVCGGHSSWVHILVRVAIILFVFWAGMMLGELKGMLRDAYQQQGYNMMGNMGARGMNSGYGAQGMGMMRGGVYPMPQNMPMSAPSATTTAQ
jgi:hypothetical protein